MFKRIRLFFVIALALAAFPTTLLAGGPEFWPYGLAQEEPPAVVAIVAGGLPLGIFVVN